jgi:CRISPR-associated protein Cas5h
METMSLPRSELSTAPESPENISDLGKEFDDEVGIVTINKESLQSRQRNPYEMLRNVNYRIYLWLSENNLYDTLHESLAEGRSVYTPALGLSECLASVEFQGEVDMRQVETQTIDSVLPDERCRVQPESGVTHLRERVPLFMERAKEGGRRTTAFTTYTTRRDGGSLKTTGDIPVATPADSALDDKVVFH